MDRIDAMRVFARVVELRSFTRAADTLHLPRATVTHAVQALETRLGTRLLQRTTRQVSPTHDGEAYYQRCQRLLADFEEAEASFRPGTVAPRGRLRVDMHGVTATRIVIPALPAFLAQHPELEIELGTGDRLIDLVAEGVDCVLRSGELGDSSLVARTLGRMAQVTCASPAYLAEHGEPLTLDDLAAGHQAVNYFSMHTGRVWDPEFQDQGVTRSVPLPSRMSVNSTDAYVAGALAGMGLIQMPRYALAEHLAAGRLREVLAHCPPPPMVLSALYPHSRQLSPRVRVFVDWVAELFPKDLA